MRTKIRLIVCVGCAWLMGSVVLVRLAAADEPPVQESAKAAPSAEKIAGWIADLDANHYLVRERATQQLLESKDAAFDALLAAANGSRPEPADRAVWILRRQGRSRDDELAMAALERLVQLKARPAVVQKAELDLAKLDIARCEARLAPLGADVGLTSINIELNIFLALQVRVNPDWHGTAVDLGTIAKLRQQENFVLQGAAFDDAALKPFEQKEKLSFLQLIDSRVSPAAIEALKVRHPDASICMRNQAKLGIFGGSSPAGVIIHQVDPGSAASTAGLTQGDIVEKIDGRDIRDFDRLTVAIAQHQPGDKIDLAVVRGDKRLTISVTLGSWAAANN